VTRPVEFSILGPLEVRAEGRALRTGASKEWALLTLLLLNADRVVPVDRIVDELWGERVPGSAQKMVQIYVSQLRKRLPAGLVETQAPGYRLALGEHVLDLRRFEQLAAEGRAALRRGQPAQAAETLRAALALFRGPALAGFSEPFAEVEGRRLEEQQLACLEDRIDADLALGREHELVAEVEALVRRNPLRERLRSQLMLALYRAGRHAEALDAYHSFRRLLDEELGIEPSEGLKELERRVLRQDASLAPPAAAVPAPARAAAGSSPPVAPAPGLAERPAGRDRELTRLGQLLAEARAGQRRVVFLTGEAGIGKTTIVDSFLGGSLQGEGLLVAHGQCVEHRGAGEPYLPVLEGLGRLGRQPGGETVVATLSRLAPTWLAQMPSLVEAGELETLRSRVAGVTHERMLRELLETLDEIAADQTLALVLEDLHWSDPSTVDLLGAIARRREPARLFVLGTYRPADALARPQSVYELAQGLRVRGLCAEIAVGALDESALDEHLARRLAPAEPPAGLAQLLVARTGGKPLFATMLLDSWLERGLLRNEGGEVAVDAERLAEDVPDGVRELIEQLRRQLDPDDMTVLAGASVVGKRFSAAAAGAAVERDEEEVEARCDALARAGTFLDLVGVEEWPDGTVASRYAFGHDLQREVLYELVPAGQRARMHARVGSRLERAYGTDDGAAALLAWHFVRARDADKGVLYLARAAAVALGRSAHQEAVAHLAEALALLERLPPARGRDERELALLTTLGPAQITLGGYASPEASATYARARALSTRLGDGTYLLPVLYGLWNDAIVGARHEEALAVGESFLQLADELADASVPVACRAVGLPHFFAGRVDVARALLERAVEERSVERRRALLERYGEDPHVAGGATLAWQLWLLGRPDQAVRASATAIAEARALEHPFSLVFALMCGALLHHFRREPGTVRAYAEEAAALAHAHEIMLFAIWSQIPLGWVRSLEAPSDAAVEELRAAVDAATAAGALAFRPYWLSQLAEAAARARALDAAGAALTEALEVAEATGERFWEAELHRQRGELELRAGDEKAAAAAFARAAELAREQGARSLELRAAVSAAALPGAADATRAALADLYAAFDEGHDTADLAEAREALGVAARG
jgi:DNA-binding SARP family transcriptional activator/predicted ATPase